MGSAAGTVRVRRDGTFGLLAPETATPLALVLIELVQNAVEHGLPRRGRVEDGAGPIAERDGGDAGRPGAGRRAGLPRASTR